MEEERLVASTVFLPPLPDGQDPLLEQGFLGIRVDHVAQVEIVVLRPPHLTQSLPSGLSDLDDFELNVLEFSQNPSSEEESIGVDGDAGRGFGRILKRFLPDQLSPTGY